MNEFGLLDKFVSYNSLVSAPNKPNLAIICSTTVAYWALFPETECYCTFF